MESNGERNKTGVVQNIRGSAPYLKGLPSKVIRTNIRKKNMQRMRNEIYYMFAPDNVFLPKDLFFIVLEFANLAQIGSRMLCFTVFFPHLVKRKNVKVDAGGDARISPK